MSRRVQEFDDACHATCTRSSWHTRSTKPTHEDRAARGEKHKIVSTKVLAAFAAAVFRHSERRSMVALPLTGFKHVRQNAMLWSRFIRLSATRLLHVEHECFAGHIGFVVRTCCFACQDAYRDACHGLMPKSRSAVGAFAGRLAVSATRKASTM